MLEPNDTAVQVVRDLRIATKALYDATNAITAYLGVSVEQLKLNTPAEPVKAETAPEPTAPETPTLEQVRGILADKSRNGHTEAVREILLKHGGSKLSELPPDCYPELLKDAEGLQ